MVIIRTRDHPGMKYIHRKEDGDYGTDWKPEKES